MINFWLYCRKPLKGFGLHPVLAFFFPSDVHKCSQQSGFVNRKSAIPFNLHNESANRFCKPDVATVTKGKSRLLAFLSNCQNCVTKASRITSFWRVFRKLAKSLKKVWDWKSSQSHVIPNSGAGSRTNWFGLVWKALTFWMTLAPERDPKSWINENTDYHTRLRESAFDGRKITEHKNGRKLFRPFTKSAELQQLLARINAVYSL